MPIKSGCYIITNNHQRNLVTLPDPNDGIPLAASVRKGILCEQWFVELHSNGTYSIKNAMHGNSFANAGNQAELNAMVEGRYDEQYWFIKGTRLVGRYTICTIDTELFWGLEDRQVGTPITLLDSPTDPRCWWTFEDAETGTAAEINKKPATRMPRWATTMLHAIFNLLQRNKRKRNHKGTIPNAIVRGPLSGSQPGLDLAIPDPVIPGPLSSNQPTPDATPIHLDIPLAISESRGFLDPLTSISEALEQVLSAATTIFKSNEGWRTTVGRLRLHLDILKYHYVELEKDFKIDRIVPNPDTAIIGPLEQYASNLKNVCRLIGDKRPIHSSLWRTGGEEACNEENIGQTMSHMDSVFDEYTTLLHSFAEQAYKDMQELPQGGQNLGIEAVKPHDTQHRRPNAYGVQHRECLPGTREETIKAIRKWAKDKSDVNPTFLLLDLAGSGKSTVAKTMAEELGRTRLIARYFFSRDTTATRSTKSFCSTVSDTLIALTPKPEFEASDLEKLIIKFKARPDFSLLSFKELFNGLVVGPLETLSLDAILIIDALDECDDDESCSDLLNAICSQRPSTPRLRILATGRPELHITRWAKQQNIEWHNFFRLEGSNKDVDLYIEQTLQDLPDIHATVQNLANGLFIWARIACELICKTADVNRLLKELETAVSLDYLYKVALDQSVPKDEGSRRVFAVVLQMILASREPLSIEELKGLAPEPHIVDQIVTRLGALLVYQGRKDPIRLLHTTFREFLTTASKADRYFIQVEAGHHTLTLGCLNYIKYQSTQNVSTVYRPDDISQRDDITFRTEYILTFYLGFTFTRQIHGCITVQPPIES